MVSGSPNGHNEASQHAYNPTAAGRLRLEFQLSTYLLIFLAVYQAWAQTTHHMPLTDCAQCRNRRGLFVFASWVWLGLHLLFPRRVP